MAGAIGGATATAARRSAPGCGCLSADATMHLRLSECPERHRVAQRCDWRNVMFEGVPRFLRHEVRRSRRKHDFVGCRSPTRVCGSCRGRTVRPELHPARRQQGHTGDDVVLGRIPMPADRRPGPVFVNQRHSKRIGINAGPLGKESAQRQQERRERRSRSTIVRLAEEGDTPTCDHATHLEVRKRDMSDRVEERALLEIGDDVVAIVEACRQVVREEAWRSGHGPSVP